MACSIVRRGDQIFVYDKNGVPSRLYNDALVATKSQEEALEIWAVARTPEFESYTGKNADKEEVGYKEVADYYQTLAGEVSEGLSPAEAFQVKEFMSSNKISDLPQLKDKLDKIFRSEGVISVNKDEAIKSGLYSLVELQDIDLESIENILTKIDKEVIRGNNMPVFFETSEIFDTTYKNTDHKTIFGTYEVVTLDEASNDIIKNIDDFSKESSITKAINESPYEGFAKLYNTVKSFKDKIVSRYKKLKRVFNVSVVGNKLNASNTGTFELLKKTAKIDINYNRALSWINSIESVDEVFWEDSQKEIRIIVDRMEADFINQSMDLIGMSELVYDRKATLDFLASLKSYLKTIKDNTKSQENISDDVFLDFAKAYDKYFKKASDKSVKNVLDSLRGLNIVRVTSELTEEELFDNHGLVRVAQDLYHKVNTTEDKNTLYERLYQKAVKGEISDYVSKYTNTFVKDPINKTQILTELSEYIVKRDTGISPKDSERLSLLQVIWNHPKVDRLNPDEDIKKLATIALGIDTKYLKTQFIEDFYQYYLSEKRNNSELFRKVLSKFEFNDRDIQLTEPLSPLDIESIPYKDALMSYAAIKKDAVIKSIIPTDKFTDFHVSELKAINKLNQVKELKNTYVTDNGYIGTYGEFSSVVRVGEKLYKKVFQGDKDSGYPVVFGEMTYENSNLYYADTYTAKNDPDKYSVINLMEKELDKPVQNIGDYTDEITRKIDDNLNSPNFQIAEVETRVTKAFDKNLVEFIREKGVQVVTDPVEVEKGLRDGGIDLLKTPQGNILGFEKNGVIYLDEKQLNNTTTVHELIHVFQSILDIKASKGDKQAQNIIAKRKEVFGDIAKQWMDFHNKRGNIGVGEGTLLEAGGQILNLNKIRKGRYEANYDNIEIILSNPKIENGFGTNKWQLTITDGNEEVNNEWFDTKNEALKSGAYLIVDYLNSKDDGKVQFNILGEQGAANLDAVEEGTRRLDNLQIAREMEEAGKTPLEIRLATEWEKGADGKWRYEVQPGTIKENYTTTEISDELLENKAKTTTLENIFDSQEVYKAFPNIKDTQVIFFNNESVWDKFDMVVINNKIYVNENRYGQNTEGTDNDGGGDNFRKHLSHEIQHLIQDIEGFARGGSEAGIEYRLLSLRDKLGENFESRDKLKGDDVSLLNYLERAVQADKLKEAIKSETFIKKVSPIIYKLLTGEVESDNVERRIMLSEEDRRKTLLSDTQKTVNEEQLISFEQLFSGKQIGSGQPLSKEVQQLKDTIGFDLSSPVYAQRPNETVEAWADRIEKEVEAYVTAPEVAEKLEKLQEENPSLWQKIMDFISNLKNWLKGQVGLSDYQGDIMDMSKEEYVSALGISVLKDDYTSSEKAQDYFKREADRLPLTLSVFSRPEFVKMQGQMINPITVLNSLNQSGIKQVEKDLIKQIIEDNYQGQKKISYDELEATVRANIMPLERIFTSSYADYGMNNLGTGDYGNANTIILNAPIEHGVTGHFSGDFKASGRKNIKYIPKQLNDNTWVAVEEGYEADANPNNIYQYVGTAGTEDAVKRWISEYDAEVEVELDINEEGLEFSMYTDTDEDYEINNEIVVVTKNGFLLGEVLFDRGTTLTDDVKREALREAKVRKAKLNLDYKPEYKEINKGMFGHIRVWQNRQRDWERRERQAAFTSEMYKKYGSEMDEKMTTEERAKNREFINEAKRENEIFYVAELQSDYFQKNKSKDDLVYTNKEYTEGIKKIKEEITDSLAERQEKGEITYEQGNKLFVDELIKKQAKFEQDFFKTLTSQEKQFIASQKEWEKRMVREAIKEASLSGATSLRFPTPYTLSVIEGYVSPEGLSGVKPPYEILPTNFWGESVGDVDFLLPGSLIKYLGKEYLILSLLDNSNIEIAPNEGIYSWYYEVNSLDAAIMYNRTDKTEQQLKKELLGLLEKGIENGYITNIVDTKDVTDQLLSLRSKIEAATQTLRQPHMYEVVGKDAFDIETSLDRDEEGEEYTATNKKTGEEEVDRTQRTVAYKYQEIANILRQERGDNFEVVTDGNGFDWYETKITPEEVNKPVVAFQVQNSPIQYSPNVNSAPMPEGEDIDSVINNMFSCE